MFAPHGLWGANDQSAVTLWAIWHVAFPAFVLTGLTLEARHTRRLSVPHSRWLASAMLSAAAVIATISTLVVTRLSAALPILVAGDRFTPVLTGIVLPLIALFDVAILFFSVFGTPAKTAVNLWIGLAVFCSLLDALMGMFCDRYTAGWYVGKTFSLLTSTVVVCAFLFEGAKSQRKLAIKNLELQHTSERERAAAQRLSYLASHDILTDLPNRALLFGRLSEAIADVEGSGERVAVIFIDVDRFKEYNDTLGHPAGDSILQEVAKRVASAVREHDTVARNQSLS